MDEMDDLENLASGTPAGNSARPRGSEIDDLENLAGGNADTMMPAGAGGRAAPGPRPRNQVGAGWGFGDTSTTTPAPTGGASTTTPTGMSDDKKKGHFDGDDDVIPVIPDLEEEAEEDITRQVAAPPPPSMAYGANVRSIRELDSQIASRGLSQLPTNPEEGVDLAILTQCLCAEHQVFEEDATWDHELIFQEVASDINAELNAEESETVEVNGTDNNMSYKGGNQMA